MSTHNHGECDHDCDCEHEFVTLTLDDGAELKCTILSIFPVDDKEYIALLPVEVEEDSEDFDGEVYIYRFIDNDDEPVLENIDDDDEFEAVTDAFDELLDSEEFDDYFDDEDEDDIEDGKVDDEN
ncbi:MAG TPA: DUF1292 domain-containing protein [Clostridiales bacterium]|nr:DUF1292 domain-containing protein [Clostridiales bacterium]